MKFLGLVYEERDNKIQSIDFSSKIYGCITLSGTSKNFLKEILGLAIFGKGEAEVTNLPLKTELKFSCQDKIFLLTRTFDQSEDGEDNSTLVDVTGDNKVLAETTEEIADSLYKMTGIDKNIFDSLFILDKESVVEGFSMNTDARASFVSAFLEKIPATNLVDIRLDELKEQENNLLTEIGGIDRFTKKSINESQMKVDFAKIAVGEIQGEIIRVREELSKAEEYNQNYADFYQKSSYMEKLSGMRAEIENLASLVRKSREATEIGGIFTDYKNIENSIAEEREQLASQEEKLAQIEKKYEEGEKSAKNVEQSFIYLSEKNELLNQKLRELISQTADSPEKYKIDKAVSAYYQDDEKQASAIAERLSDINREYEALAQAVADLKAKKENLTRTASYKKSIIDAAYYEDVLRRLEKDTKYIDEELTDYEKEQGKVSEQCSSLAEEIRTLTEEQDELSKKIKGVYPTFKDAINADALYKQTIYSKHLTVSANEIEINALDKKILEVKEASLRYRNKLENYTAAKAEVELHLEKLNIRYEVLVDKRTEYDSFNRMQGIADDLEYGSNCPVCDGFIMNKKPLAQKDIGPLDKQISAVKKEIQKSENALKEAIIGIGEYEAAARVGEQYQESLENARRAKQDIIDEILAKHSAKDIPALFKMVKETAEKSNNLTHMLDRFNENYAKLQKLNESNSLLNNWLSKLTLKLIPETKERLNAVLEEHKNYLRLYKELQPTLEGQNADELLVQLQVVEKEYETIMQELSEKEEKLQRVGEEREELNKAIILLDNHSIPVKVDGKELNHQQIVVKAVMDDLKNLIKELEETQNKMEITKIRLSGIRRVVAKAKEERGTLSEQIAITKEKLNSVENVAKELYSRFEDRINALELTHPDDISALILDENTIKEYQDRVVDYDNQISLTQHEIEVLSAEMEINKTFYDRIEEIKDTLAKLQEQEQETIYELGELIKTTKQMRESYDKLLGCNLKLSYLQAKIKGIEDISSAIKDGSINGNEFAGFVIDKACSKVKNWSKDKYSIGSECDGIYLINNQKGKKVAPSKYNKEEKMLVELGLSTAFQELLVDALSSGLVPVLEIADGESDKSSLGVILEASRDRDIIVLPTGDEKVFLNNLGKLI